jgi:hypothetical protein
MEDAAHLTVEFMLRSFGVTSGDFGCVSFDPLSFQKDGLGASEVDVSRCEIGQALMLAAMVVYRRTRRSWPRGRRADNSSQAKMRFLSV